LKAQRDTVVSDLPANTFVDGHATACRDLGCSASVVVLFKSCRCGLDAESTKRFFESIETLRRNGLVAERRLHGADVNALTDFQELAFSDELPQTSANLVITPEIVKIRAQKDVSALARNALFQPGFQGLSHAVNIRHFVIFFNIKSIRYRPVVVCIS